MAHVRIGILASLCLAFLSLSACEEYGSGPGSYVSTDDSRDHRGDY